MLHAKAGASEFDAPDGMDIPVQPRRATGGARHLASLSTRARTYVPKRVVTAYTELYVKSAC